MSISISYHRHTKPEAVIISLASLFQNIWYKQLKRIKAEHPGREQVGEQNCSPSEKERELERDRKTLRKRARETDKWRESLHIIFKDTSLMTYMLHLLEFLLPPNSTIIWGPSLSIWAFVDHLRCKPHQKLWGQSLGKGILNNPQDNPMSAIFSAYQVRPCCSHREE
jgi:hypothetical protein